MKEMLKHWFFMIRHRQCWTYGRSKDWKFTAFYTWHDGPIFVYRLGSFWFCLTYDNWER